MIGIEDFRQLTVQSVQAVTTACGLALCKEQALAVKRFVLLAGGVQNAKAVLDEYVRMQN